MHVNRNEGTIRVFINEEDQGEAFRDEKLTTGELFYAASISKVGDKIEIIN
jgi:hypothetical protein